MGAETSPEWYANTAGTIRFRTEAISGSEQVSNGVAVRFELPRESRVRYHLQVELMDTEPFFACEPLTHA